MSIFRSIATSKGKLERRTSYQHVACARGAELSPTSFENVGDDISKGTLIWRAIKLPIYSVALVPLTVGSAAAYLQTGMFSARCYFVLLASSILVITWLNLSRTGTFIASYLCLAFGFIGLTWIAVEAGNIRSILFLASAIICGYIYQCPPFRLSYQGLGEPLCFAAFGPFATCAFYLLQGGASVMNHFPLTGTVLSASILVGFTTSLILFCSHFHQVRLGTKRGAEVVKVAVMLLYALLIAFGLSKALPLTCIDKNKIFMAKYFCVRLHTLFGAALAFGLVVARMVSTHTDENMENDDVDMVGEDNTVVELDEMKKRLKEMEDEAAALREMQAKVEKEMGSVQGDSANAAPSQVNKEEVDSRSVFVGNVDYACTPEEVQQHFQSCGTVNRVTIRTDKFGQPKGYAYVEFLEVEAVQEAILLNESELHGRQLKVTAKRTNVPGMKQFRARRPNPYMGFRGRAPYAPPFAYAPYGYGKVPRFRMGMRYNPYY
ncbi:hypothetical protein TanjilG_00382 [Lupinus angustifolius]|uniref:RRM domain-containing protein n=2 Tax=Lupinus angustifolius TaxID=3871 RepID=A0A1J7HCU5_LUPAN|nr:hypothetical protein TanjilG_00382 [Lupinus angustifolius]